MKNVATWIRAFLRGVAYTFIACCLTLLLVGSVQAKEHRHQIQLDQTVSEIAYSYHVSQDQVCKANHLRDCNKIIAGHWLRIPAGKKSVKVERKNVRSTVKTAPTVRVTPRSEMSAMSATSSVSGRHVVPNGKTDGWKEVEYYEWKHPGGDSYRGRHDYAFEHLGYPNEVARILASRIERQDRDGVVFIERVGRVWRNRSDEHGINEFRLGGMAWGRGSKKTIAWIVDPAWQNTDVLMADLYIVEFEGAVYYAAMPWACDNPTKLVPLAPQPIPEAPPATPEEVIAPKTPLPAEQRQMEGIGLWNADLFSIYGHQYGVGGGESEFVSVSGAFRPFWWDTTNKRHMVGVAGRYNAWWGHAADGFEYKGILTGGAPSYKMYDGRGYDLTLNAPFVGVLDEWGHSKDGKFRMEREFKPVIGFEVFHNRYKRELAKKVWFPELQMYLTAYFPLASDAKQSWEGRRLPNTGDVDKLDVLFGAGVRQFIYDGMFRPYVSANFFAELPLNATISPCIGASDHNKILFVEGCYGFGILNGGDSIGWNVGIDWMAALRYSRGQRRTYAFDQQYPQAP